MIKSLSCPVQTAKGPAIVTVQQIPAMRSGKLLVSLVGVLGPSLGAAAVAAMNDKPDGFADAVGALGEKLTPAEFERITGELLDPCTVKVAGQEAVLAPLLDELFTGHVGELFKLIAFALKANYSDFFDGAHGLGSLIGKLKAMGIKIPNKTPSGSSGPQSA